MLEKSKLSVFGGTGFIGGAYIDKFKDECLLIPRDCRKSETNNILYFISTVDNYNVFDSPFLDVDTNISVLLEVLDGIKDRREVIFNFISSWFVYGKVENIPVSEDEDCDPRGFYSITKRAAEQLLISYCKTFGIKYRILRLCNVYGVSDNKFSVKRNALQYLIAKVVSGEDINLYNDGNDIRDFMHVSDVCNAIDLVITKGDLDEIYNIGSGVAHKFIDMMNYVKLRTGSVSRFISIEPPEFHKIVQVKDMVLNVDKLTSLGFRKNIDIEDGLDELIYYMKERHE